MSTSSLLNVKEIDGNTGYSANTISDHETLQAGACSDLITNGCDIQRVHTHSGIHLDSVVLRYQI